MADDKGTRLVFRQESLAGEVLIIVPEADQNPCDETGAHAGRRVILSADGRRDGAQVRRKAAGRRRDVDADTDDGVVHRAAFHVEGTSVRMPQTFLPPQ